MGPHGEGGPEHAEPGPIVISTTRLALPGSIALVPDALPCFGGAERVLEVVIELVPDAPIHTLVFRPSAFAGTRLQDHPVQTSFIDRLPGAHRRHRAFLPLFPLAIESFDLTAYDLVLSFNYAVAHGVVTRPDQLHVSYTYTPLRHLWHFHHEYLRTVSAPRRWLLRPLLHYLRVWDRAAADRVDSFLAISRWVSSCIWRAYRRRSVVVHPPVDVDAFAPGSARGDHYVAVSRLEPHKRLDLVVDAFSRSGRPLLVVGEGSEGARLRERAQPNVSFLGRVSDQEVAELLARARGLVHAGEEDFGIAMVEAQAAGCPVVAYSGGAASEIVADGRTGVLFPQQTVRAVQDAVETLEALPRLRTAELRASAERFSRERFKQRLGQVLEREWETFQAGDGKRGTHAQGP
jgi:glycosyltransferase involved in cell wall biosynthesis